MARTKKTDTVVLAEAAEQVAKVVTQKEMNTLVDILSEPGETPEQLAERMANVTQPIAATTSQAEEKKPEEKNPVKKKNNIFNPNLFYQTLRSARTNLERGMFEEAAKVLTADRINTFVNALAGNKNDKMLEMAMDLLRCDITFHSHRKGAMSPLSTENYEKVAAVLKKMDKYGDGPVSYDDVVVHVAASMTGTKDIKPDAVSVEEVIAVPAEEVEHVEAEIVEDVPTESIKDVPTKVEHLLETLNGILPDMSIDIVNSIREEAETGKIDSLKEYTIKCLKSLSSKDNLPAVINAVGADATEKVVSDTKQFMDAFIQDFTDKLNNAKNLDDVSDICMGCMDIIHRVPDIINNQQHGDISVYQSEKNAICKILTDVEKSLEIYWTPEVKDRLEDIVCHDIPTSKYYDYDNIQDLANIEIDLICDCLDSLDFTTELFHYKHSPDGKRANVDKHIESCMERYGLKGITDIKNVNFSEVSRRTLYHTVWCFIMLSDLFSHKCAVEFVCQGFFIAFAEYIKMQPTADSKKLTFKGITRDDIKNI